MGMKIEIKQLSLNCCNEEYEMLQNIKNNIKEIYLFWYKDIKLFPYKNNIPTIKIILKNSGQIVDYFDDEKYVITILIK